MAGDAAQQAAGAVDLGRPAPGGQHREVDMGPGVVHQHHARRVLRTQDARVGGAVQADDLEAGRCPGGGEDPQNLGV